MQRPGVSDDGLTNVRDNRHRRIQFQMLQKLAGEAGVTIGERRSAGWLGIMLRTFNDRLLSGFPGIIEVRENMQARTQQRQQQQQR